MAVQDTARFCGWRLNSLTKAYLLTALRPSPLLVMGNWPSDKPYDQYWRPGLMVVTPQPIIDLLMPCAAAFKAQIAAADAAGQDVPVSARGICHAWQSCCHTWHAQCGRTSWSS